jgi:hypothetical protein
VEAQGAIAKCELQCAPVAAILKQLRWPKIGQSRRIY